MIRSDLLQRVGELRAQRTPFVFATVVRVARPASAHPGDSAILLPDGTLEGFVGGMCSESTVRTQGLRQLASGRSVLLHITPPPRAGDGHPGAGPAEPARPGPGPAAGAANAGAENEVTVGNPCLSGGELDIFLQVMRPPALVHLYGDTPVAHALAAVGAAAGLDIRATADADAPIPPDATAVVVASQGGDEHRVIAAALDGDVAYVGLLASRRRGAAVIEAMGLTAEQRDRLHTPVGLDIHAQSPGEVAVSILAEIIATGATTGPFGMTARGTGADGHDTGAPAEATDPVCGMTVAVTQAAIGVQTQEGRVYFCCPGCRDSFLADPQRYNHSM